MTYRVIPAKRTRHRVGLDTAIGLVLAGLPISFGNIALSKPPARSCMASTQNLEPNGETILSPARSPTTFRLLREERTRRLAGLDVRGLKLKSVTEWRDYSKSGKKPDDIPATPERTYAEAGWAGVGDWLGTGTLAPRLRQYRSFKKARAFVHGLNLKSRAEWTAYCQSGKKPDDIPTAPAQKYAEAGWAGVGDWLSSGRRRGKGWRNFKEARAFVHGLGLKSETNWREYCRSGKKPADIPAKPDDGYANDGWAGMPDWLGYVRKR
jgi:hypothetical protein